MDEYRTLALYFTDCTHLFEDVCARHSHGDSFVCLLAQCRSLARGEASELSSIHRLNVPVVFVDWKVALHVAVLPASLAAFRNFLAHYF